MTTARGTNKVKPISSNTEPNGKTMNFLPIILDITEDSQLNDVYVLA